MTATASAAGLAALPRPLAFVLGGGASFGAAQVGMVRALEEAGVHPDLVVGTSVGALNGAVLASSPGAAGQALEDTWLPMRRRDVFPGNPFGLVWRLGRTGTHAMESEGLQSLLEKVVQASTFDDLALPLSVVTVDLDAGCEVVLDEGPLVPALLASAAIPGVFVPVRIGARRLVDGGVLALVPVAQALARGARSVVSLDCTIPALPEEHARAVDLLAQVVRVQQRAQLEVSLERAARQVPVVVMPSATPQRISPMDFSHTERLMGEAHRAGGAFLRDLVVDGPGIYGDPYRRYAGTPVGAAMTGTGGATGP